MDEWRLCWAVKMRSLYCLLVERWLLACDELGQHVEHFKIVLMLSCLHLQQKLRLIILQGACNRVRKYFQSWLHLWLSLPALGRCICKENSCLCYFNQRIFLFLFEGQREFPYAVLVHTLEKLEHHHNSTGQKLRLWGIWSFESTHGFYLKKHCKIYSMSYITISPFPLIDKMSSIN